MAHTTLPPRFSAIELMNPGVAKHPRLGQPDSAVIVRLTDGDQVLSPTEKKASLFVLQSLRGLQHLLVLPLADSAEPETMQPEQAHASAVGQQRVSRSDVKPLAEAIAKRFEPASETLNFLPAVRGQVEAWVQHYKTFLAITTKMAQQ